ncbi:hypothetical protein ACJ72_01009 [Emergomyces africanus]|uniref:Holocytochrome c-type synthase n=1 Tax=Emergomyces africanus TaxID=1955775 RepID=A0A1B7P6I1_9EURO|nr:hypothetical protein ACJ72_01009 [Emergomyces africanus]
MGANASTANPPPPPIAGPTLPTVAAASDSSSQATCPVDHKTRAAWLSQHQNSNPPPPPTAPTDTPTTKNKDTAKPLKQLRPLSREREVSSIPRAIPDTTATPAPSSTPNSPPPPPSPSPSPSPYATKASSTASHISPSNDEAETGHDSRTGNWIYPSERQFFEALLRKNTPTSATSATDLATSVASIIPIHNAVNERAWSEILDWESSAPTSDPGSRKCGGPKLYSFRGLGVESQFLSPRARINGWLGYQRPFDRHDWVVERCGGARIEYVIDFYQGRSGGAGLGTAANNAKLNFYLDVRPKLNSWEGWRMRATRLVGLG